jgi:acyl-homoserine-lactone acylase
MKKLVILFAAVTISFAIHADQQAAANQDLARWQQEAKDVTIIRDDWGIAHVYGKTDADAVFGMEYAQAEDDFNRVETNYINAMGLLSEAEGEQRIYQDLRAKLFCDPDELKKDYAASPAWLQKLMDAFADGLNYYLYKHPEVKPRVITHFEPWMALSFTEGSIGGDTERVNVSQLQGFYSNPPLTIAKTVAKAASINEPASDDPNSDLYAEPTGSNGMAVGPSITADHHALLLINPHTSFYFRSELQMVSDEGLDAYGAATWGQFFIYQGFNPHDGWMHTSSGVDAVDQYLETVEKHGDGWVYKYGDEWRPVIEQEITVAYKSGNGMAEKKFTVFRTKHGPVIGQQGDKWITISLMQEPIKALEQSYLRTKTSDYDSFRKTMELQADSSNNTIFADDKGNIAYFHGNFIPRRDNNFDFTKPVDGSNPATDWHGLLSVDETPHLLNPPSGWIYNSNDAPWSAAGPGSLKKADYPLYVEKGGESARGHHAVRVLSASKSFTLDSLIGAAFDSYQPWFEKPIPALLKAWDDAADDNAFKVALVDQIGVLRNWDLRWGADSVATSLAVFWGDDLRRRISQDARRAGISPDEYAGTKANAEQLLQSLSAASDKLTADFGTWRVPWGAINRFQRLNDDIAQTFDDSAPSIPVEFTSATWGSLASFGARAYPNTKKWYGTSGNSFVAVVEFGPTVHARAVTCGGESGHPGTPHFTDEAKRYSTGDLREVYFYRDQLKGHTEREYHPGE